MLVENAGLLLSAAVPILLLPYLLGAVISTLRLRWYTSGFPVINKLKGEWSDTPAVKRIARDMKAWIQKGYYKYNGPFPIIGSFGTRIVLPPDMAEHVKSDPRFSADEVVKKSMASTLPGFEGLRATDALTTMIRTKLSTNLEWHEVELLASLRDIVTQVSTRIFLGPELYRDEEWLDNIQAYTNSVFHAVRVIRSWPEWSRPYMIEPIIAKRIETTERAKKGLADMPNDAMTWMHQIAMSRNEKYHGAHAQLSLSMASVHTTSDLTSNIVLQLCRHPEVIEPLLKEIREVRDQDGKMSKTSLYQMKLADSVMKETQRLKPLGVLLTHRYAHEDVTLPDGTLIPRGAQVGVNMSRMWDPKYYPNPEEWQPDRFPKLREEAGKEHSSQFVTTTMESLGFGIGTHACPGRFFAVNKVKILLAHILEHYEFERVDSGPDASPWYIEIVTNPKAKLRVRRKQRPSAI
ncbi:cytochrome P450 [Pseudoneurospora amorphoporcata]|uniref:Cytochrome P450 n=1 Tax=Pseudoneurospora amorphoporcata TaxID=241081 RepID=A0AAN6SEI6_9PEZI|nr:cytochrome P450 [Pseudoneurospora amorphoporcata]